MASQAVGLATQYNEVTRNLSAAIQVHKLRAEWNEWNGEEVKPQDHESLAKIFHVPPEQSTLFVPSVDQDVNQSNQKMIIELTHRDECLSMEWKWIPETSGLTNCHWKMDQNQEDGMLVSLDESKLHAWLLQRMEERTGMSVQKTTSSSDQHLKSISSGTWHKYDQYLKAINQIGAVPDTQGRLLDVVGQIRNFEQNLLRVMKGLSCL